jgi:phospholipase C
MRLPSRSLLFLLIGMAVATWGANPAAWATTPNTISHVVIIVQENHSFDEVFGGYGISTVTGTTATGSTLITRVSGAAGLSVGSYIIGEGLPLGTTITGVIGAAQLRVSNPAGAGAGTGVLTVQQVNGLTQAPWPVCGGVGLAGGGLPSRTTPQCTGANLPYPDHIDVTAGGEHTEKIAQADLDDGVTTFRNDGYLKYVNDETTCPYYQLVSDLTVCQIKAGGANGTSGVHDVLGYRSAVDIPNFWSYAQNYTVLDNFFEGTRGFSLPSHIELVAEWVAYGATSRDMADPACLGSGNPGNPSVAGCHTANDFPAAVTPGTLFPYVNLFELFDVDNVTWRFYAASGASPDCIDGTQQDCPPQLQSANVTSAGIWNVAGLFNWVKVGGAASGGLTYVRDHVQSLTNFLSDATTCHLRNVSWVVPTGVYSEHPGARTTTSMEYVTALVNAIMNSPCKDSSNGKSYWDNTVIFVIYDDWGGFFDHALPPNISYCQDAHNANPNCDATVEGWGLRVPGIVISPYVTPGSVDHDLLSFDSIATFIEDTFIPSQDRLNPDNPRLLAPNPNAPLTPDSRPTIGDAFKGTSVSFCCGHPSQIVGDLRNAGGFAANLAAGAPTAAPDVLSTHIPTGLSVSCNQGPNSFACAPLGSVITVDWQSISQLTSCFSGKAHVPCVPNPSASITYNLYRTYLDGSGLTLVCKVTDPATSCTDKPPTGHQYLYRVSATVGSLPETPRGGAMEADD